MTKIALVGLNARYSHSNLAIKYLKESTKDIKTVDIYDFTINDEIEKIIRVLLKQNYSHIGFSVYIWNKQEIFRLIKAIKNINQDTKIIVGGPEVSYDGKSLMVENDNIDYVLSGEGEESFRHLVHSLVNDKDPEHESILFRKDSEILGGTVPGIISNINHIPNLYMDEKYLDENKYVYYEASRGCPFRCAFCLSSTTAGVRFKNIETVLKELETLLNNNVKLVKFIDRSFNSNPKQKEIIQYLIDNDNGITTFHMELHPSLIKEEFIDLIKLARKDLFQFEVGLQTTNIKTAKEIERVGTYDEIHKICSDLIKVGAHIHIDLIAGLPYEDLESFSKSFNDLYNIKPDKIQLGFLKLLKGSRLRIDAGKYNYRFFEDAPYEFISNNWISYSEVLQLKAVEDVVERYYNEGFFSKTTEYLIQSNYKNAWDFYLSLSVYWDNNEYMYNNISRIELYNVLYRYCVQEHPEDLDIIAELLIYDYYKSGNRKSSKFVLSDFHKNIDKETIQELLRENANTIEGRTGIVVTEILKHSIIESFNINPKLDNKTFSKEFEDKVYIIFVNLQKTVEDIILKLERI
ncbi:B12-binding domain-containing radical SAM protein [Microaceticoccus formicicus]|uniref:B12-binding domain-containing radical SAM protein n=1 Tax=Microaceticoccus formicicus TaxID=3118105 RepID=UPI003CD00AF1|nr:B12-binding domain-containing radical SAM protein [Peptoniphilaceae bacterium AMB_02]